MIKLNLTQKILFAVILLNSMFLVSQIKFENGYIITANGEKTNCLIKNLDWKNNPHNFEYKLSENASIILGNVNSIKEFSIENAAKYVRKQVDIELSSEQTNQLSTVRKPVFNEEILFLKVIVEGNANLYSYDKNTITKFFYDTDKHKTQQLIYKSFLTSNLEVGKNNYFKQQLFNNLKCSSSISAKQVDKLRYTTKDLTNFFVQYNACKDGNYQNKGIVTHKKRNPFNLSIKGRINKSSLTIENGITTSAFLTGLSYIDFGSKTILGFGVELLYTLPFNENKWAIFLEPSYQNFNVTAKAITGTLDENITLKTIYNSIEVPLGIRHNFFLSSKSKLFINTAYAFELSLNKPSIIITRENGENFQTLDINSFGSVNFGIGYKYNNKYSIEMRFYTKRNLLGKLVFWGSEYKNASLVFGYTIF